MNSILRLSLALFLVANPFSTFANTLENIGLPADIARILDEANCAVLEATDYFACPEIRAYRWTDLNLAMPNERSVNRAFENKPPFEGADGYSVASTTAAAAATGIRQRLRDQSGILKILFENGEIPEALFLRSADLATNILSYVESWNGLVFMDDSTYWAPSVNASAVILIDTTTGVVIEILHGDTDG